MDPFLKIIRRASIALPQITRDSQARVVLCCKKVMSIIIETKIPKALLVSVQTPDVSDQEAAASLVELERLVCTLGFIVLGSESQRQPNTTGATAVGSGKLKDLEKWTKGDETVLEQKELASVVVFDCELRPSQLRHLENALGVEVLDRTGVIIEIFSRHAKTRAARLQVEIARLNYLSPRLRETGTTGERQAGRGSGESALQTERRSIRDQLAELRRELTALQDDQAGNRSARSRLHCVALVGYTNAGKSSTMRALTGSDVLVEDKLFATLDTTVRSLKPEAIPRILVSDTVGFIHKLPHDLVASFRSTLEEALHASLLLYVVDASDPMFRNQLQVVEIALQEVGVKDTDSLLVLNKSDQVEEIQKKLLKREFPEAILMSTRNKEDIGALREKIIGFFERGMTDNEILVPYTVTGVIGEIRTNFRVVRETYEEEGTRFVLRAREEQLCKFKEKFKL
jgi:GTPase